MAEWYDGPHDPGDQVVRHEHKHVHVHMVVVEHKVAWWQLAEITWQAEKRTKALAKLARAGMLR